MKKVIKKGLVVVALLAVATLSYGNEISGNSNDGKIVRTNVTFKNVKEGSILSIKDLNGLILYRESIKLNGHYSKGFDLTSLPDGEYYFEMDKDVEIKVVPFKVRASAVTFDKKSETRIFKPIVFVNSKKHVFVSKVAIGSEVLAVEIYADSGDILYSEKISRKGDVLGKIYDFSTSSKGVYTIITKTDGRKFVKNIRI